MSLDYLLYDNRTPGPTGRDWGVKIAAGSLATDRKTRRAFVQYCRSSFSSRVGALTDFGAALGGIPVSGGGYLLCVTLEIQDAFGRPSCGFVGIYCHSPGTLRVLLEEADPIAMAQWVYEGESRPATLELRGRSLLGATTTSPGPRLIVPTVGPRLGPFITRETPREVVRLLARESHRGTPLPAILGIAAWRSRRNQLFSGFQLAFYRGLPQEMASPPRIVDPFRRTRARPITPSKGRRPWFRNPGPVLGIVGVGVVLGVLAIATYQPRETPRGAPRESPSINPPAQEIDSLEQEVLDSSADRAFLARIETLSYQLTELRDSPLDETTIYAILQREEVLPEYQGDRARMIEFIELGFWNLVELVEEENLEYYFSGRGREIPEPDKAKKIRKVLADLDLPESPCPLLTSTFRALMNEETPLSASCRAVDGLTREQENADLGEPGA